MKTEVQELLMEFAREMKRSQLTKFSEYFSNPGNITSDETVIQQLVVIQLKVRQLSELAHRLSRATEGQFADLVLALDTYNKWPPAHNSSFLLWGLNRERTAEEQERERQRAEEQDARWRALAAVNEALKKIGSGRL